MARNKVHRWTWLLLHVAIYSIPISVVVIGYAVSRWLSGWSVVAALTFVGGTHAILDRRSLTRLWIGRMGASKEYAWLPIVADTVFHLLTLAVSAQPLAGTGI